MLQRHSLRALGLILAPILLAACSGSSSDEGAPPPPGGIGNPGSGSSDTELVSIELTDTPFEHALLAHAILRIDRVTAHIGDDDEEGGGGFVTLYEGDPIEIDVAPLVAGIKAPLASNLLPVGTWSQLRLHVASAELALVNGNVYSTDDGSLHLPSAAQSGFKVLFDPPLVLVKGDPKAVVIDFDLTQSFKPIPANDPQNADSYQMHPVLRVQQIADGGSIAGVLSAANGQGLTAATLYVLPKGSSHVEAAVATTGSAPDGSYLVNGLAPGQYELVARHGELEATAAAVAVTSGQTTQVDLDLE